MIEIQNPLITYVAWIGDRDLDWADTIASSFLHSLGALNETRKLLDVSKEEYDAKLQEVEDYLNETPGEDGGELIEPLLEWSEDGSDCDDEDEFEPGSCLSRLVSYINKFIELDDRKYILEVALQLFIHTDFMLFSYTVRAGLPDVNEVFRERYIKSLLDGNIEKAEWEENELHLGQESTATLLETKASWDNFIIENFNREVFLLYYTFRLFG